MLSDWTPHETVADLRRVAEEVVALAVVGADEAKTLVVPGHAHTGLARAALAAELASLSFSAAGVAGAGAAGSSRRAARARARLVAARRRSVGHLCCYEQLALAETLCERLRRSKTQLRREAEN